MLMTCWRQALWAVSVFALLPVAAFADSIKSPIVTKGEAEIELKGEVSDDRAADKDGEYEFKIGTGYGVTDHWFVELESEWKRKPEDRIKHEAIAIENRFQILPQGAYLLDLGFYAEYEFATQAKAADSITFGPILRTDIGAWRFTANPFLNVEVGAHSEAAPQLKYGVQGLYTLHSAVALGVEAYGKSGALNEHKPLAKQEHQIGPVLTGKLSGYSLGLPGKFGYEAGALFGLTPATAAQTYKFKLEYEFAF
jgi:hypothetical protein